ncbi:glutathione S-transferase family protein [Marinobacter hydrocarbonoclasticus]|nr:glutathione S-transferase family protein [Marinobacter nauticus]
MMKIVSFTLCPFVQRITALLEAKGLPYEVEYIALNNKPQWFLDISPNGQVPVLITENGTPLFESDAIAEYLEEAYPALQPGLSPEQKALNRAWSALGSKQYLVQCGAQSSKDADTLIERNAKLATAFAKAEKALGAHPYFNSDTLGMVDIAWLPVLHRAHIIEQKTGYDFLDGFPRVKAWQATLLADDLAQRSVSAEFMARFSDFYLSGKTLLGRCQKHLPQGQCSARTLRESSDCCA